MQYRAFFLHLATTLVVVVLFSGKASAQASLDRSAVTLQVRGLTSAMRDGLAQDLKRDGHYRIAFACVPAGILVLEPIAGSGARSNNVSALPLVHQRIDRNSIVASDLDRNAAESRCAEARNR
ncbi:MAG: hypothetical protein JNL43_05400 [Flavobacteriales bacterium]|nr:hypothetical protein [Flavobacteriales bacterium]